MNDLLQLNIKPQAKAQKCKLKPETSDAAQEDPPKGFRLWGGSVTDPHEAQASLSKPLR